MGVVPGWWVVAAGMPRAELAELAGRAGGWCQLEGAGEQELVGWGVARDFARSWLAQPAGHTLGHAVPRTDPRYPRALVGDDRAPPVLYVEGDPELLGTARPRVAVVGTRRCSARGAAQARSLGSELARAGAVVVSGLALGIDAEAHTGAVAAAPASTIAVLGHGLGHQSVRSNLGLRRRIAESGGAVVSGWPDDFGAERWTFAARNRWIAGLSGAVAVLEAPAGSGALITARDALELGRDTWVALGRPDDPLAAGAFDLLQAQIDADLEQAALLRLRLEQLVGDEPPSPSDRGLARVAARSEARGRVRPLRSGAELVERVTGVVPPDRESWLLQVCAGEPLEAVARAFDLEPRSLQAEVTRRELAGELVRLPSGRYGLA